ncbi:MAG: NADP-dependent isocitrate dehydrogenase, partial [Acidimicrobiales bacterium]
MTDNAPSIVYTHTDEAPALATRSLLPIVEAFARQAGVPVTTADISLSGRILAAFSDLLPADQRVPDTLAELGALALRPEANIIKLPNVSASMPQLKTAIAELQALGYALPDYPDEPSTPEEVDAAARYDKVKGSAVNPVLREGNSDRRAPRSVKEYARTHPHSMGAWSASSKTNVATMSSGDFRSTEQSVTIASAGTIRIEHVAGDGDVTVLKGDFAVQAGEIVDAAVMRRKALVAFLAEQVERARTDGGLLSVHLKATIMKVSDPIIFGHAVRTYFADLFDTYGTALEEAGVSADNGMAALLDALDGLPADTATAIRSAIDAAYAAGPALAMVDSDKGITNLHVPSDVIVDASMPAMIRTSGQMWNAQGAQQDTLAVLPDSSYAGIYQVVLDDCRANGAFDPATMGSVPNVGLMAQKAEEYGSHDKTFQIESVGVVRVVDGSGTTLIEHPVAPGDIWRACQTKQAPVLDWVKLAVTRARATGTPAVFWLDETRAHDAEVIAKVRSELPNHDTDGLQIEIMAPVAAIAFSLERIRRGEDTISVTGNVLRD